MLKLIDNDMKYMKFTEWLELTEMASRKKKSQPTAPPKKNDLFAPLVIRKADQLKTSMGHQSHITGTGVHTDKRLRRQKTRGAKNLRAINDQL